MMELILGGAGSGKSSIAESRICCLYRELCAETEKTDAGQPSLYYIADMIPRGPETKKKIERHRKIRSGKGFLTLEWYLDLPGKAGAEDTPDLKNACVLLECISNLTANEMYEPEGAKENTVFSIIRGINLLKEKCRHLVIVTNDVFRESVADSLEMEKYKKNLAAVNIRLAAMADRVTEAVFGIPVPLKPSESGKKEGEKTHKDMIIITGGKHQGKMKYAAGLYPDVKWIDGAQCPLDRISGCRAIYHFEEFVRRWMAGNRKAGELTDIIARQNPKIVIVCNEIGCGIVPVDDFERAYREDYGRICTDLAETAWRVYRVTAGIGMRIK